MSMRPKKVSSWRDQLPPPFDQDRLSISRHQSAVTLTKATRGRHVTHENVYRRRSNSASAATEQSDRRVIWKRLIHGSHMRSREEKSDIAIDKLRRLRDACSDGSNSNIGKGTCNLPARKVPLDVSQTWPSVVSTAQHPTHNELLALANQCFSPIEQSRVIITEYTQKALRVSEYTLEEVLASDCILQPGDFAPRVRWIYVEYHKLGTFWGSDHRYAQWGTDPAIFEKSPIILLQQRLAELDRHAGRPPLSEEELPGHKRVGKYYRGAPGCPEYLGLRVSSASWLKSEPYELLLDYLDSRPWLRRKLQKTKYCDLDYGLHYINAVNCIKESAFQARPGLRDVHKIADQEKVYLHGSWDDTVERVEFYREHTLLSCGSPRFYKDVADRLLRKDDVLRQNPDCALLYYTLARVSIENDEMMQDTPERALNQIFARLKEQRNTARDHVETVFSLQQAVIDGLEYLEENKCELPIWGIPPFDTHLVRFHPGHAPPQEIRELIQAEMDLVEKDFNMIIGHWRLLRDKVDRYLDVLLQFRVLDQQELALSQSHLAGQQQTLAVEEARRAGVQARSVIVFTAITIIFLPLSFFTSYFGMNVTDIANTQHSSGYFWMIAGPVSGTIIISIFAITRYLSMTKHPVLDEEKGTLVSNPDETRISWSSLLGRKRGKVKEH